MTDPKPFWLEQRYVFPVIARTFKEAEEFAFRNRELIARECGPVDTHIHNRNRLVNAADRDGWKPEDYYVAAKEKPVA